MFESFAALQYDFIFSPTAFDRLIKRFTQSDIQVSGGHVKVIFFAYFSLYCCKFRGDI